MKYARVAFAANMLVFASITAVVMALKPATPSSAVQNLWHVTLLGALGNWIAFLIANFESED